LLPLPTLARRSRFLLPPPSRLASPEDLPQSNSRSLV
ncbi:hypothetical protein BAE44_0013330, partial [Dichanthelium oligosanthes]